MRNEIDFETVVDALFLDRLLARILIGVVETNDGLQRQQVNAAEIEVGIGRRKAVQVGSTNRGEHEWERMRFDMLHHFVEWDRHLACRFD